MVLAPTNIIIANVLAHIGGWQLSFVLYLCFLQFLLDGFLTTRERWLSLVALALGAVGPGSTAFRSGSSPRYAWSQIAIIIFTTGRTWSLTEAFERLAGRPRDLTRTHRELADAHRNLAVVHARLEKMHAQALAQEKMSSLGVMAAGIAHGINNTMAYVTSNLHELMVESNSIPHAAPPSPSTSRTSCPRPSTEFAGSTPSWPTCAACRKEFRDHHRVRAERIEIQAALRILHGGIRDTCRTEVELGDFSPVVGRPQQLMQVVINLVLNAAQAAPGGTVRVSTASAPATSS